MYREAGYIWQFSVLSAHFCYEFRTALKEKGYLKVGGDMMTGEKFQNMMVSLVNHRKSALVEQSGVRGSPLCNTTNTSLEGRQ